MKKLLLFSFLILVLACSSSENDQNNSSNNFNPPEKLISSIYVSSVDCSDGEMLDGYGFYRLDIYYTNNIVTGSDRYDCDFNCDVFLGCDSEISWWDQYITTGMSSYNEFPITNEGGQYTISYNNNYVVSKVENDGTGLFHYYSWDDGKLTNITTYLDNEILFGSVDFTYSNLTNLTGLFPPGPWGDAGYGLVDPLGFMGAAGNITSKLPSSIVSQQWDENTGDLESVITTNFNYQLDNEGYVTSFETIGQNGFKYTTTIEYQ